jgi:proline dehydrogenase
MLDAAKTIGRELGTTSEQFEFQMLYGIRRDLQRQLVREGYRVRVYIPYGDAWYPYFMRRLAERPANVFFLIRNLFRS